MFKGFVGIFYILGLIFLFFWGFFINKKRAEKIFIKETTCERCGKRNYQIKCDTINGVSEFDDRDGYPRKDDNAIATEYRVSCKSCGWEKYIGQSSDHHVSKKETIRQYIGTDAELIRYLNSINHLSFSEGHSQCMGALGILAFGLVLFFLFLFWLINL